jgi:phosphoribosylformylglycinamidine cyclo-ligase
MSVNDILTLGAEPFLFLDYFATSHLDLRIGKDLIRGIAEGCRQAGAALVGGETAEMPQVYRRGDFDLAGFCVGVVEAGRVIDGAKVREGDVIVGLPSSGIHSNGYSLVRAILRHRRLPRWMKAEILRPTRIYVRAIQRLLRSVPVCAMAHITGGGIEGNLPRVFPKDLNAEINRKAWRVPSLFRKLQAWGKVAEAEMFRTFNMGIGFIVVVRERHARRAVERLPGAMVLGRVVRGRGESKVVWRS